ARLALAQPASNRALAIAQTVNWRGVETIAARREIRIQQRCAARVGRRGEGFWRTCAQPNDGDRFINIRQANCSHEELAIMRLEWRLEKIVKMTRAYAQSEFRSTHSHRAAR